MTRTAASEFFGLSRAWTSSASIRLGLPHRPGGARLHSVTMTAGSRTVRLPDARLLRPGGEAQFVVIRNAGNAFDLLAGDGSTVVASSVSAGIAVECYLLANSTEAGEWCTILRTATFGTPIATGRQVFDISLAGTVQGFKLGPWCANIGWDESSPIMARVTITAGSLVGAIGDGLGAFYAKDLPSGSRLLLRNHGYIVGHGGNGGGLGQTASDGQPALEVDIPTVLVNQPTGAVSEHGTIAGGGGGGLAAGPNVWLVGGGGGGGGAGSRAGIGAFAPTATYRGSPGENGQWMSGGRGGVGGLHPNGSVGTTGGAGGDWGEAGEVPVGILSAATSPGLGILGTANVTKLVAGTILGGEA